MDSTQKIITKSPSNCSPEEIRAFIALVLQGGEVPSAGLSQRVSAAAQLAFLYAGPQLLGIAALKNPNPGYRAKISEVSGVDLPLDSFPYELGWVFVAPEARRQGHSHSLSQAALSLASGRGVFATSRKDNVAMHNTLAKLGFVASGSAYASQQGGYCLQVFARAV